MTSRAIPIGEHFYRVGIFMKKEGIVVVMLCGECDTLWEEIYKFGDEVNNSISCPHCGLTECYDIGG